MQQRNTAEIERPAAALWEPLLLEEDEAEPLLVEEEPPEPEEVPTLPLPRGLPAPSVCSDC
jgi:hypothetical protein